MEELKMQNSLLLQLINSKNRQNQILFQQYDQLAADNRQLQAHADQLRAQNNQLKRSPSQLPLSHDSPPRPSPFDQELAELKKKNGELQASINELKAQLEERGGTIILLQEELQKGKQAQQEASETARGQEQAQELKEMLRLKEQAVSELTEYMQTQADKIADLTRAGIIAIDNYEAKIAEKDTCYEDLTQQIAQLKRKITDLTEEQGKTGQQEIESAVDLEKVKDLQTIILSKEQSIAELSEFLQAQSERVSKLEANLSESNVQVLQGEIDNLRQIVQSKESSILELSDFLNVLSLRNKQMEERVQRMEEQPKEKPQMENRDAVAILESKIQKLNEYIASQNDKIAQLQSKPQESDFLISEAEMLRARLSTKEDELSLLTGKLEEREAQLSELRVQLDEKIVKITLLENISEQNEADFPNDQQFLPEESTPDPITEIEEERPDYEGLLQLKSNEIEALKAAIEQKDQSLRDFTEFISQQTDKISALERTADQQGEKESQQISELQSIIKAKDLSIDQLRTFLQESYAKNAEISSSYRQSQENCAKLQEQVRELKGKAGEKVSEQMAEERINIILSQTELGQDGSPRGQPVLQSLQDRIKQLESELASKAHTIAELSEFMNTQAESLRAYKQQQELNQGGSKIAELEAIIKLKEQSNNELSAFLQEAYAKTTEMDFSLTESQRNMLNVQEQLFSLQAQQGSKGAAGETENTGNAESETTQDLKNIIAEKHYKISELTKSNQQLAMKCSAAPSLLEEELKNHIQSLESTLASKEDTIGELTDFMNQQAEELDSLTNKLEALRSAQKDNSPRPAGDDQGSRGQLEELELTLKSKDENINELTEFMAQQAQELEELRAKFGEGSGGSNFNQQALSSLMERVATLQEVIKSKELSQTEAALFLQEAYSKIAELQQQRGELVRREAEMTERLGEQQAIVNQLRSMHQQGISALSSAKVNINHLEQQLSQRPEEAKEGENVQALKATIQELEDVVNTKSQTIADLSEFMNEQSLQLEELEQKLNGQPTGSLLNQNISNNQRVEELQAIIRSKQVSIAELTQFLEEAYAKNAELQQSIAPIPQAEQQDSQQVAPAQHIEEIREEQVQKQVNSDVRQREALLQKINSQIEQKSAQISEINSNLEQACKQIVEHQQKLASLRGQIEEAQSSYNNQVDEYNQHRESMDAELGNVAQALEEQIGHLEMQQKELSQLQRQANQLQCEIKRLQQERDQLSASCEAQKSKEPLETTNNTVVVQLQAKVTEYEGFLNDREEEMAAMMEVMENLQAEIGSKNQLISHLQEGGFQTSSSDLKVQKLQEEIRNLKQTIQDLQGIQRSQRQQMRMEGQEECLEAESKLLVESQMLKEKYQQELREMKLQQEDLERELNLQGNFSNEEEVENNEQLTVLQVIEQIMVYSQEQVDMSSMLRMIEMLKRSYLKENESIIKENSELKDTLNNILEINSSLVEEIEKFKTEREEQQEAIQKMDLLLQEAKERQNKLETDYRQEIQQLRSSITDLRETSPIGGKQAREEDLNTISKLEDEVVALRQENQQKEVELAQLKANSNKKFVKELNNLLDSCTVAKEGEELREVEEELERATAERDEAAVKCREYENQLSNLQKLCAELTTSLQNMAKNQPHASQIQNTQGQDSMQTAELLAGLEEPMQHSERRPSELEEDPAEKWRAYSEELQGLLQEKSAAISELQETMLGLEKGYNNEIMNLRKNVAELKNEAIALRKSLYQANPNGVDIGELIKDTFSHSERDTEFFRPAFPTYTHSLHLAQPHNSSYYSEAQQPPRPPAHYQRYFPPNAQLNLGEKFMGRRCRQASPFNYADASRATIGGQEYPRY